MMNIGEIRKIKLDQRKTIVLTEVECCGQHSINIQQYETGSQIIAPSRMDLEQCEIFAKGLRYISEKDFSACHCYTYHEKQGGLVAYSSRGKLHMSTPVPGLNLVFPGSSTGRDKAAEMLSFVNGFISKSTMKVRVSFGVKDLGASGFSFTCERTDNEDRINELAKEKVLELIDLNVDVEPL